MPRPHYDASIRQMRESEDVCDCCTTTRDPVPPTVLMYELGPAPTKRGRGVGPDAPFLRVCRSCAVRLATRLLVGEGLLRAEDAQTMIARTLLVEEDDLRPGPA